ncbi:hypothetical protein COCMIDRAFT_102085, partial [Bipolaris oryzae ATCC 44560]
LGSVGEGDKRLVLRNPGLRRDVTRRGHEAAALNVIPGRPSHWLLRHQGAASPPWPWILTYNCTKNASQQAIHTSVNITNKRTSRLSRHTCTYAFFPIALPRHHLPTHCHVIVRKLEKTISAANVSPW